VPSPILALTLSATVATPLPEPDLGAVRSGVRALREGAQTDGTWGLVRSLISAGVAVGLAVLIGATDLIELGQDSLTEPLIVAGLAIAAGSQIAEGLYDVLAEPATVESADLLLDDPDMLESSGVFFLHDRALAGRDDRIRGAILEITSAAGGGVGAGLLFASDINLGGKNILAGIGIGVAGIQLITGILKLFRRSTAEEIYESVMATAKPDRDEEEEDEAPGGPSFGATVTGDHVGVAFGGSF
jgi:hypothetical protein